MKKTYINPSLFVVNLSTKGMLLEGSMEIDDNTTVSGNNGGWVKEESNPISDKNLWDDEW